MACNEPKWVSSHLRRVGPIPGILSSVDAIPSLVRCLRWAVMAKRWASSRMRWIRYSPCEWRGSRMERLRPGHKDFFLLVWPGQPPALCRSGQTDSSTLTARPSWPLPPSTINRSGRMAKAGSSFLPRFVADFLGGLPAFETAGEHFFHAGEIIRPDHRLDIEMAVILLCWACPAQKRPCWRPWRYPGYWKYRNIRSCWAVRARLQGLLQFTQGLLSVCWYRLPTAF